LSKTSLSRASIGLKIAALAAVYVAAAKLGIELPVAHGVITPVWAPTGIALAVLFVFGIRLWPGVALGAFIANATSDVSIGIAAGIAIGNTLEAVVGAWLLKKSGFDERMGRVRDVIALVAAAVASTTISATNGITTLWLGDVITLSAYWSDWFLWWFGDAMGDLLVAPALFVWFAHARGRMRTKTGIEAWAAAGAIAATSLVVFLGGRWRYPYLLFPLLMWAALRFRQLGSATAMLIVGGIGIWGTVEGSIAIGGASATQSVQILQGLVAVVGVSLYVVAASVSERDAARRSLEKANAGLADAQVLAHIGSWEWDIAQNRVSWSDEMYRIYGYDGKQEGLTFERALERVAPDDVVKIENNVKEALASGRDQELAPIQYRVIWPDGSEHVLRGKGVVSFEASRPARMVGTVEDVTEAVVAEKAITQALERERTAVAQLRELDHAKNTFISAIAHDLRSPLAAIAGLSRSLMQLLHLPEDQIIDILDKIGKNALRAAKIVADLLDVDRLSRGAIKPSRTATDVSDILIQAAGALASEERQVHIEAPSGTAWIDQGLVRSIVDNLLINAVSHTPPDTEIWIKLAIEPDSVVIAVEDAGRGVPDEYKASIFEAFQRGSSEPVGGTGLGLYLVAQFARLHDGKAWVEDRPGGGAIFKVLLPSRPESTSELREEGAALS
jgi:signal transduction histidine kinase/integral membrane sensor domain MASE1